MANNLVIVTILTIGFSLASFLGYLAHRAKLPPILGYLLAGFIIGPFSPGYVADLTVAEQLAEVGMIFMLFGVGLHFKLEDLNNVKGIAIPGATIQSFTSAVLGGLIAYAFGWTWEASMIIGLSIGVASTVVLVRVLSDNKILDTIQGHISVGWLIVEDLFTILVLVLLPMLASVSAGDQLSIGVIVGTVIFMLFKFFLLVLFMFTFGKTLVSLVLINIARVRSEELFTVTVLAVVLLIATASSFIFGTSLALGAFISGMVVAKTRVKYQAASNALTFKDVFAIIFFLSVGMLFNPHAILTHLWLFLGILSIVLIFKPFIAYVITRLFGYSVTVSLAVAFALGQIGEFSFILAQEGMSLDLFPEEGYDLLVAVALVSISINPLLFKLKDFFGPFLRRFGYGQKEKLVGEKKESSALPKAIIVGYGPIGKAIATSFRNLKMEPIIIDNNIDVASIPPTMGEIIFGDATRQSILLQSHVDEAKILCITIPDTQRAIEIIHAARHVNPRIKIIAQAECMEDMGSMKQLNVTFICNEKQVLEGFLELIPSMIKNL